jgi:F-type H+-transporting ATPase subunit b
MGELFATFGIDWRLLLMQAVNFGLLLLVLWKFLYTPVLRMLDERRGKIAESVQKAESADRRLADADKQGKDIVAAAGKEATSVVASARNRAEEQAAEIARKAQERADRVFSEAQKSAEEAKRQALAAGEKEIARAAMLAAEKLLKEKHS